jgi:hypothetical protein
MQDLNQNIEARSLKGVRFYLTASSYVEYGRSDWGIWDKEAGAWYAAGGVVTHAMLGKFQAPYRPAGGRKAAKAIEASGLYCGYKTVKHGEGNLLPKL